MIVRFEHYRFPEDYEADARRLCLEETCHGRHGWAYRYKRGGPDRAKWQPAGRGGYTRCLISWDGGANWFEGIAECSPLDHFSYAKGRALALRRALSAALDLGDEIFNILGVMEVA